MDQPLRRGVRACLAILVATGSVACGDQYDPFVVRYFGLEILAQDSLVFRGRTLQFLATAPCNLVTCVPPTSELQWSSSNPARATVSPVGVGTARVTALDTGVVHIVARLQSFTDSQFLQIVDRGMVRWRLPLAPDASRAAPSIAVADTITPLFALNGGGAGRARLRRVELSGSQTWEVNTCPSGTVAPSVAGLAVVSGPGCTSAHDLADGTVLWELGIGLGGAGVVQRRLARWLVLHVVPPTGPGDSAALTLSLISSSGTEARRTTVYRAPTIDPPTVTPAVAADGDVILAWVADGLAVAARIDSLGGQVFQDTLPSYPTGAATLGADGTILFGTPSEVVVLDSLGNALWTATEASVSTPVVDGDGHVYVETAGGLVSYTKAGALRWRADSLGSGQAGLSPAPVSLQNGELLAVCKGNRFVCWVRRADGSVIASRDLGTATSATPAVTADGSVVVVLGNVGQAAPGLPALVALWGINPPLPSGWGAEGRSMSRNRSLLP